MTYASYQDGSKALILSPAEVGRFEAGEPVEKRSGDCKGHFKIVVKMTRPRSKAKRFAGL